jgi:uncharacterized protein YeaO (DUF488 family)
MPNLGPSEKLLSRFKKIPWAAYARLYRAELFDSGSADKGNKTIKNHGQKFTLRLLQRMAESNTVTLLCHCAEHPSAEQLIDKDLLLRKRQAGRG